MFPSLTENMSDEAIDEVKATDQSWFEFVYGPQSHTGQELGNTQPGDGYKFRGRGGCQITGRTNYTLCGKACSHSEVVDNPDLVSSDPAIGMAMTVAYIRLNYHGGGFETMMRAVGNNTPDIAATKERYFAQYMASGEFAAGAAALPAPAADAAPPAPAASIDQTIAAFTTFARVVQGQLRARGLL